MSAQRHPGDVVGDVKPESIAQTSGFKDYDLIERDKETEFHPLFHTATGNGILTSFPHRKNYPDGTTSTISCST